MSQNVDTSRVTWTDDPVVIAYCGDHLLGAVPAEHVGVLKERVLEHLPALLSFRGKTAYAVLLG